MSKEMFIVFAGIDGASKDTVLTKVIPLFYNEDINIRNKYQNVIRTREPTTHSREGRILADGLANKSLVSSGENLADLYITDRIKHCQMIKQYLNDEIIVLCSRYDLSTYAYQSNCSDDLEMFYKKHKYKSECLIPDLTLYFKLSVDEALERIKKSGRPFEEFETKEMLEKTLIAYQKSIEFLQKKDNRKIIEIDASQKPDEVYENTRDIIYKYM